MQEMRPQMKRDQDDAAGTKMPMAPIGESEDPRACVVDNDNANDSANDNDDNDNGTYWRERRSERLCHR